MAERINKDELVRRLAARMHADEAAATAWVEPMPSGLSRMIQPWSIGLPSGSCRPSLL